MINEDRLEEALILVFGYLKTQQGVISALANEIASIREAVAIRDPEFFELLEKKRLAMESQVIEVAGAQAQMIDETIQKLKDGYLLDDD